MFDNANSTYGMIAAITIVIALSLCAYNLSSDLVSVVSTVDNSAYMVRKKPNMQEAADMLARVRASLQRLVRRLSNAYLSDERVRRLKAKFSDSDVREVEANSKYTSYSVNKGERLVFCLRSRDAQENLVDMNTIMFVALHEMAHIMTKSIGHTSEFWENFRFLLAHAIHWRMYTPVNFRRRPQPYCGTHITDTPLDLKDMPKYVSHLQDVPETNDAHIAQTFGAKK